MRHARGVDLGDRASKTNSAFARRFSAGRLLFVAILLLAFSVQTFVNQTHIHNATMVSVVGHTPGGHDNYPGNEDPSECPLCQQILQSGAFVAPAGLAFFLPMLAISVIAIAIRPAPRFAAVTHNWLGRGPPQH